MFTINRPRDERGQVLIIVAAGLLVIVAMVGLVVDGGYAWGQQRATQNASDAASEAGAAMLAANLAGVSPAKSDLDVQNAVNASGQSNGIGNPVACYTNFDGAPINLSGAVTGNHDCTGAALVGNGSIAAGAYGVMAQGQRTFNTFLMRAVGFPQLTTTTLATARAGYQTSVCSASEGCIILPVTVPVTVVTCDGSGNPVPDPSGNKYVIGQLYIIPLCKNGPGNVGWIDWTPTAGGTSELIDSILHPDNPALKWPGWYYMTSTGNVNSKGVEDALRTYDGQPVSFPQFDNTCDTTPTGPGVNDCPAGHVGGHGSNQWYHIGQMATFVFCGPSGASNDADCAGHSPSLVDGTFVNGNNSNPCDTGNGATACLAGKFTVLSASGEVTAAPPADKDTANVGVQLIR
jgi:Flp pilus assembly protein TadG